MSKPRIPSSEFVHLLPEGRAKVRVNHDGTGCSGGRDSMVIERKSDGRILAYCFRCGGVGLAGSGGYYRPPARADASDDGHGAPTHAGYGRASIPSDRLEWPAFPSTGRRWLTEAGINASDASKLGIFWSDERNGMYIPVLNNGGLRGHLFRQFDPKVYRKFTDNPAECFGHWHVAHSPWVVLTEDYLSCYRVARCGFSAIALMGTEISTPIINAIHDAGYVSAAVFLDADNPTVRIKARKIAKSLPFLRTHMIETGDDPKHMTDKDLQCLLSTTFSPCSPSATITTGSSGL